MRVKAGNRRSDVAGETLYSMEGTTMITKCINGNISDLIGPSTYGDASDRKILKLGDT